MEKIKMFLAPHKALRKLLGEFTILAGQTNYQSEAELEQLKAFGKEMFTLLNSHAKTEDHIILSALEAKLPGAAEHDMNEHVEIESLQRRLETLLNDLSSFDDPERGYNFYQKFSEFHGIYLEHMLDEEKVTQKQIWEHMSDEEQLAVRTSIITKMDPEIYKLWMKHMIPAQNESENTILLGALQKNMTPEDFASLIGTVRSNMQDEVIDKLLSKINEPIHQ